MYKELHKIYFASCSHSITFFQVHILSACIAYVTWSKRYRTYGGLLHSRSRNRTPPPHVREHREKAEKKLQLPSIGSGGGGVVVGDGRVGMGKSGRSLDTSTTSRGPGTSGAQ